MAAPKHCPHGHPAFSGKRCPMCAGAAKAKADLNRPSARARGYDGKWQQARASFLKSHPTCACGVPATVVDHVKPHKGDMKLFWDKTNWQQQCPSCHSRKTAERDGGFGRAVKPTGGSFEL